MSARINKGYVYENMATVLLDRIEDFDGTYPTADDIAAITIHCYDLDTGEAVAVELSSSEDINPADVMQSSLQTDQGWTRDGIGWNSQLEVSGDYWPEGGRTYRLEIIYRTTDGKLLPSIWELTCIKLYSQAGN